MKNALVSAFQDGLQTTARGTGHVSESAAATSLPVIIGKVIGTLLIFVGVIFLGLIIYGGYIWMTSKGNEQAVSKAKGMIKDSIIGLILVLAAYAITAFFGGIIKP